MHETVAPFVQLGCASLPLKTLAGQEASRPQQQRQNSDRLAQPWLVAQHSSSHCSKVSRGFCGHKPVNHVHPQPIPIGKRCSLVRFFDSSCNPSFRRARWKYLNELPVKVCVAASLPISHPPQALLGVTTQYFFVERTGCEEGSMKSSRSPGNIDQGHDRVQYSEYYNVATTTKNFGGGPGVFRHKTRCRGIIYQDMFAAAWSRRNQFLLCIPTSTMASRSTHQSILVRLAPATITTTALFCSVYYGATYCGGKPNRT